MNARFAAEAAAKRIAEECCASGAARRMKEGKQFMAVGGCDEGEPWHFALEYASPEDRADVDAWIGSL